MSLGFKHGASSGTGPTLYWDDLAIISLALPTVVPAVANSPTNVTAQFGEPVSETTATNLRNYRLASASGPVALVSALFTNGTNLVLTTAPQAARTNYTLTVSNVVTSLQPTTLTGRNGQVTVRVPLPLVPLNPTAVWLYDETGNNLGTAWRTPAYDDSSWSSGLPLLGFSGSALVEPILTQFTVAPTKFTYYFRKRFVLPTAATNAWLRLHTILDDGAVFWLNGSELFRLGMTNNPVYWTNRASRMVAQAASEGPFDLLATNLVAGTNLLAVEVHQNDPDSADVVFGAMLEALVLPSEVPVTNALLSLLRQPQSLTLTWAEPALTLETATNLPGPWLPYGGTTNSATIFTTNPAQFFRLRQ